MKYPNDPGIYEVIYARRDVRREFTGKAIEPGVLHRILGAAHAAPSVGLSQPWNFIVVTSPQTKESFWEHVQSERQTFADSLPEDRNETFSKIRIEGILDATVSLVVTYDPTRGAPSVLGRHAIADAGLYSVCLAIENLWLAATAEGLGLGWVSFYREEFLQKLLDIPTHVRPVAWLCLGPVSHLEKIPDLERANWRTRVPLEEVVSSEKWGNPLDSSLEL